MIIFKKKIVILYLQGGIGNLFFGLSAAIKFNNLNSNNIYYVELEKNRLTKIKKYLNLELIELKNFQRIAYGIYIKESGFFNDFITRFLKKTKLHFGKHIHGGYFEKNSYKKISNKNVLTGYFQHPDFYKDSKDIIADLFFKKHKLNKLLIKDHIAIHLRRADYINHGWELSLNYYKKILLSLSKDANFNSKSIKVFSDDPFAIFAIKNLADKFNFTFIANNSNNSDLDDFIELICSKTLVMSNSSFCWWAAVIGDRLLDKKRSVFYPEGWIKGFNDCLKEPNWRVY
ncbi:MAG: hypothetical protein CMN79_02140 [Spirochaetales bacterium]|jgi:glycosyltransferase involved in cell wall biosynthesis|nr:hypothetical protein [Spirochaetales bacterium]